MTARRPLRAQRGRPVTFLELMRARQAAHHGELDLEAWARDRFDDLIVLAEANRWTTPAADLILAYDDDPDRRARAKRCRAVVRANRARILKRASR